VTAAPHGGDTDYRSRPTRPDYETYLRRIGRRSVRVGVHADPTDCDHPYTSRVTAEEPRDVAACFDCGSQLQPDGRWWVRTQ
jgi:hypothetical protein